MPRTTSAAKRLTVGVTVSGVENGCEEVIDGVDRTEDELYEILV